MKNLPKDVLFVQDPIYCQDFLIIITPTYKKCRKYVKQILDYDMDNEEDDSCTGMFKGLHHPKKGDVGIIWSSDKKSNLIHEIFHATSWAMRNRDLTLDSESTEEAWAYYLSYLYREIQEQLNDSKR